MTKAENEISKRKIHAYHAANGKVDVGCALTISPVGNALPVYKTTVGGTYWQKFEESDTKG